MCGKSSIQGVKFFLIEDALVDTVDLFRIPLQCETIYIKTTEKAYITYTFCIILYYLQ